MNELEQSHSSSRTIKHNLKCMTIWTHCIRHSHQRVIICFLCFFKWKIINTINKWSIVRLNVERTAISGTHVGNIALFVYSPISPTSVNNIHSIDCNFHHFDDSWKLWFDTWTQTKQLLVLFQVSCFCYLSIDLRSPTQSSGMAKLGLQVT